ncbi:hypothetical protein WMO41_01015 [Ventrimonas sp. CLA-AP-H27]|uniref:Uncharacterized protein n=1 Tax=Ventrimonas faecis TaxID=3133170 RepID=A0ABV1HHJ0_9FIRM
MGEISEYGKKYKMVENTKEICSIAPDCGNGNNGRLSEENDFAGLPGSGR